MSSCDSHDICFLNTKDMIFLEKVRQEGMDDVFEEHKRMRDTDL